MSGAFLLLIAARRALKVALIACMRQLLTLLNAILRTRQRSHHPA